MNAKQKQSIAVLEEWFQNLYVELVSEEYESNNELSDTKLNLILNSEYKKIFFSTSEGYCLKKVIPLTLEDGTSTTQTYTFYLIQKDKLPKELQSQIMGADNVDSKNYRRLQDVYGITSDLRVYYCQNGFETIVGLNMSDINKDSPDIIAYNKDSLLAKMVNGGTSDLTNQSLKNIKSLTIDSNDELPVLNTFKDLYYLKIVHFTNVDISTLSGMGGAENIEEVQFENCGCEDYSDLCKLEKLNILYLIKPKMKDVDVKNLCSESKGIAKAEFENLEYFGIVGNSAYLQTTDKSYSTNNYDIKDISSLSNLSDVTKKAVKYLYIHNNNISSIESLSGFTNVLILRMELNPVTSFNGIQNMSKLQYLIAPYCYNNTNGSCTLGSNEGNVPTDSDALDYIYKDRSGINTSLYYVNLEKNSELKYVDGLTNCNNIEYLYLGGCNNIKNIIDVKSIFARCGNNYTVDSSCSKALVSGDLSSINLAKQSFSIAEFEELKNKTNLKAICLNEITIKDNNGNSLDQNSSPTFDDEVNSVLETCVNLEHVELCANKNLTTIRFVKSTPNLISINLTGTRIKTNNGDLSKNGLELLNNYCNNLGTIVLNGTPTDIDLTKIEDAINKISKNCFDEVDDSEFKNFGEGVRFAC